MKAQHLAVILIYLAVLFHLLAMSGWVDQAMQQPIQLAILALLLTTLFVLRQKKRKSKRRRRMPPAEVQALADHAEGGESGDT